MLTSTNAKSVPMLTSLTISVSGTSAAMIAIRMPSVAVMKTGVRVLGCTYANRAGISPSRDIANMIRVCP